MGNINKAKNKFLQDISELEAIKSRLKKTEEKLRLSEKRYRSLFDYSPVSIWEEDFSSIKKDIDSLKKSGILDLRTYFENHPEIIKKYVNMVKVVDANSTTLELFGAKSLDEFSDGLGKVFNEESYDTFKEEIIALAERKKVFESETANQTLMGKKINTFIRVSVASGYEATLSRVFVSVVDITRRKQMENALQISYRFLEIANNHREINPLLSEFITEIQKITDCVAAGIRVLDDNGNIVHTVYKGFINSLPIKSNHYIYKNVTKNKTDPELPFYTKDGSFYINSIKGCPDILPEKENTDNHGYESIALIPIRSIGMQKNMIGLLCVADHRENMVPPEMVITLEKVAMGLGMAIERVRTNEALAEESERLAITLRSIGDGVITTDEEGKIVLINEVAESLTGWAEKEAIGKPLGEVFNIINEKNRERYENPIEKVIKAGKTVGFGDDVILLARDGTECLITDSVAPVRREDGNIIGTVLVFRDITEKRKMENELVKIQKLESVGVLAGGIAHDFNNILTGILGNISLAKMFLDQKDKAFTRLTEAEKASLQASDLTKKLLTFSSGGTPITKKIFIAELLKDSIGFALSGSNIGYQFYIPNDLWMVEIDEGQISQVIHNVVTNAKQAMPEGGIIKVYAENLALKSDNLLPLSNGYYVKISIEDQGIGVPEEYLGRIFDPYFTTKQKGSGLGLAISYSIIIKHNGYITAKSQVGVGTTIIIYLPAFPKVVSAEEKKEKHVLKKRKILLMDDEEIIRELAIAILNNFGYEVTVAVEGAEAISLYKDAKESGVPFDAVIMDLTVHGGMGGKEAIKKLIEFDPEVKAIVSSGYSNDLVMTDFKKYGFTESIIKPYKPEKLISVIQKVITTTVEN